MKLNVLCGAQGLSSLGDSMTLVTLVLVLQGGHDSAWGVGLVGLLGLLPSVFIGPIAAPLLDRVETSRVLLATQLARLTIGLALAFSHGLVAILGLVLLGAVVSSLDGPAMLLLVANCLSTGANTARGYGRLSTFRSLGSILGPGAAGLLVQLLGSTPALLVDAATFAVLACTIAALRVRRPPENSAKARSTWWAQIAAGPSSLGADPVVFSAVIALALAIVFTAMITVAEVFYVRVDVGAGPAVYGTLVAVQATGRLCGFAVIGPHVPQRQQPLLLMAGGLAMGVALLVGGGLPLLAVAAPALFFVGIANSVQSLAIRSIVRERTPAALHGRAFAALMASNNGATLLGTAAGAPAVTALGGAGTLVLAGAGTLLTILAAAPVLARRQHRPAP